MTIYRVDVEVTAPVKPTEVPGRVADAILNLFPDAEIQRARGELRARTHSLDHLSQRLHEQEILDTARRAFEAERRGERFTFALKKQAAFQGVVNFAVGSPGELGDLTVGVVVHEPDVGTLIDHVAPPTKDGRPVDPDEHT